MGMSYDEYWNGPTELCKDYRKAFELKRRYDNQRLWLQGFYILEANLNLASSPLQDKNNPFHYPTEPLPLTAKEMQEQAERQAKEEAERQLAMLRGFAAATRKRGEPKE